MEYILKIYIYWNTSCQIKLSVHDNIKNATWYCYDTNSDMNNITEINTIVKACSVKITTATKVNYTCINKPPLPTDLFEFINTLISCITTTDIDAIEGSYSYSLRDIVPRYRMKIYPLLDSWEMKIIQICQETLRHLAICFPHLFWT